VIARSIVGGWAPYMKTPHKTNLTNLSSQETYKN
jgi:hypothetical protein